MKIIKRLLLIALLMPVSCYGIIKWIFTGIDPAIIMDKFILWCND